MNSRIDAQDTAGNFNVPINPLRNNIANDNLVSLAMDIADLLSSRSQLNGNPTSQYYYGKWELLTKVNHRKPPIGWAIYRNKHSNPRKPEYLILKGDAIVLHLYGKRELAAAVNNFDARAV